MSPSPGTRNSAKAAGIRASKQVQCRAILSLSCNFLYALYHGVLAALQGSLWFGVLCIFYGILAAARFCAVACESGNHSRKFVRWELRGVGALLLLLSAALAGVNAISLSQNIAIAYQTIPMITIATYTFYKVTVTIVKAVRQRGEDSALFLVLRTISYAEGAASLVTLQRSMLVSFGTMQAEQTRWMNALTGAVICLFILSLGIGMIVRSGKENKNGKVKTCKSQ